MGKEFCFIEFKYKNRVDDIDILKKEIDELRPLNENELRELKEYYRINL